jgi:hypothetical protein
MSNTSLHLAEGASTDVSGNQSPNNTIIPTSNAQHIVTAYSPPAKSQKRKRAPATPTPEILSTLAGAALEEVRTGSDDEGASIPVPAKKAKTANHKSIEEAEYEENEETFEIDGDSLPTSKVQGKGKGKGKASANSNPKTAPKTKPAFTNDQIQTFLDSVAQLNDWSSTVIKEEKFLKLIQWFDKDLMGREEIRKEYTKYVERDPELGDIAYSYLHRIYNDLAPGFYADKGITPFIPLKPRQSHGAKKVKKTTGRKVRPRKDGEDTRGPTAMSSVRSESAVGETFETREGANGPYIFEKDIMTDEEENFAIAPRNRNMAKSRRSLTKKSQLAPESETTVRMKRPAPEDAKLKTLFAEICAPIHITVKPKTKAEKQQV